MKPGALVRKAPFRRHAPRRDNRPPASEVIAVIDRDGVCIARQYDPSHACLGRLTMAHVPELGENAYGMKPPSDRYHMVAECYGANSGGLQSWSEMNRDRERAHLAKHYPERYRR